MYRAVGHVLRLGMVVAVVLALSACGGGGSGAAGGGGGEAGEGEARLARSPNMVIFVPGSTSPTNSNPVSPSRSLARAGLSVALRSVAS